MTPTPDFYVSGLDLGQKQDFTCLITLAGFHQARGGNRYIGRGLKRWPLGTSYAAVVDDLKKLFGADPLKGSTLACDRTGCGQPVIDMIQAAAVDAYRCPILITGGHKASKDEQDHGYHVPKLALAATVGVLLESARIELPATLPHRDVLVKELQSFKARITTSGQETAEADSRTRAHDDMVLALACAAWLAEHTHIGPWDATPDPAARLEICKAPPGVFIDHGADDDDRYDPADDDDGGSFLGPAYPSSW